MQSLWKLHFGIFLSFYQFITVFKKFLTLCQFSKVCTEPHKFPQCPVSDPQVDICKLAKPFTDQFVYCCHKPMDPHTVTTDLVVSTSTIKPNLHYECDFMG